MDFIFFDFEYIIIYLSLLLLFILSLHRREVVLVGNDVFSIDLNMSNAMKGIACIMILTSHWGTRKFNADMQFGISMLVWNYAANIALVWFMFFSGFGLSLKEFSNDENLLNKWIKRLKKVYLPLFLSCLISTIGYFIVPASYPLAEYSKLWIPEDIWYLHHFSLNSFIIIWPHILGWKDWYVLCIIIFYSFFYFSKWIERRFNINQTTCLFALMILYYFIARIVFGSSEAHFYRYCWVFFLSHVIAKWNRYPDKRYPLLMIVVMSVTLFWQDKIQQQSLLFAVISLLIVSIINNYYTVKGKIILFLGSISYFFYLLHCRICYVLVVYLEINSIIGWIIITLLFSTSVYMLYNKLFFLKS